MLVVNAFFSSKSLERLRNLLVAVTNTDCDDFVIAEAEPFVLLKLLVVAHNTFHGKLELALVLVVHGDAGHHAHSLAFGSALSLDILQNAALENVAGKFVRCVFFIR